MARSFPFSKSPCRGPEEASTGEQVRIHLPHFNHSFLPIPCPGSIHQTSQHLIAIAPTYCGTWSSRRAAHVVILVNESSQCPRVCLCSCRPLADKAKQDFAHPLGVQPKHRKIVRFFGQVLSVSSLCTCLHQGLLPLFLPPLSALARCVSYCSLCLPIWVNQQA